MQVREMFDHIHKRYDLLNHLMSAGRDIHWRKRCCKSLPAKSGVTLLDLCGGTGDFSIAYKNICGKPNISIVGDFAEKMLLEAEKKDSDLKAVQMDATQIPLENDCVDVILNGFGMRNIPNTDKALNEAFRVLKTGGYFATLEFFKPEKTIPKLFYKKIAPLALPFAGMLFSKKNAYRYLVVSILNFLTSREYVDKARKAGFVLKKINALDGGLAYSVILCKK